MNSNGILHLTVSRFGRIRSWESPHEALDQKEAGEVVVSLTLTKHQITAILRAELLAKTKPAVHLNPW